MLVSLGLFALIATAGFAMLAGVLQVRSRTEAEVARLGDLQRLMFVLTQDFSQVVPAPLTAVPEGVSFQRAGLDGGAPITVSYRLADGALFRRLGTGGSGHDQRLLMGVSGIALSFHARGGGWSATWPAPADGAPDAIAIDLTLDPAAGRPSGSLRRVVELPALS